MAEFVDLAAPPVDARVLASERDRDLLSALDRLPANCQRLLRLLMEDPEPSYQDVSRALDMPIGSIGPTRGRCLHRLRRELGGITDGGNGSEPV